MSWQPLENPVIVGLPDLCADLFSFLVQIRSAAPGQDAAAVRTRVQEMLRVFERNANDRGVAASDAQDAEFALVSTIDELLLTSDWRHRGEWKPIAEQKFKESNAGEVFYDRLQAIQRGSNARRRELVEVYATCIYLGFRGMYAGGDRDELRNLLASAVTQIGGEAGASDVLSTGVRPAETVQAKIKRLPIWLWVSAGLAIAALVNVLSRRAGDAAVRTVVEQIEAAARKG